MSLTNVQVGDKLVVCVQRYDTVADQDFDTLPLVNIGLNCGASFSDFF